MTSADRTPQGMMVPDRGIVNGPNCFEIVSVSLCGHAQSNAALTGEPQRRLPTRRVSVVGGCDRHVEM